MAPATGARDTMRQFREAVETARRSPLTRREANFKQLVEFLEEDPDYRAFLALEGGTNVVREIFDWKIKDPEEAAREVLRVLNAETILTRARAGSLIKRIRLLSGLTGGGASISSWGSLAATLDDIRHDLGVMTQFEFTEGAGVQASMPSQSLMTVRLTTRTTVPEIVRAIYLNSADVAAQVRERFITLATLPRLLI